MKKKGDSALLKRMTHLSPKARTKLRRFLPFGTDSSSRSLRLVVVAVVAPCRAMANAIRLVSRARFVPTGVVTSAVAGPATLFHRVCLRVSRFFFDAPPPPPLLLQQSPPPSPPPLPPPPSSSSSSVVVLVTSWSRRCHVVLARYSVTPSRLFVEHLPSSRPVPMTGSQASRRTRARPRSLGSSQCTAVHCSTRVCG